MLIVTDAYLNLIICRSSLQLVVYSYARRMQLAQFGVNECHYYAFDICCYSYLQVDGSDRLGVGHSRRTVSKYAKRTFNTVQSRTGRNNVDTYHTSTRPRALLSTRCSPSRSSIPVDASRPVRSTSDPIIRRGSTYGPVVAG